jgi:hypothetical protein
MRTNNLLATGGMMQEGGTTDPVSGNDVPIGSLKEEVRDDIPAQLSPGEFVFPADVTRYIGLDKLMQIREAAKEGLKEMESKGQMGNAEEVEGDAVDEDKFSTNIDEIIANLDGGDDSEPKKFAEGGSVNTSDYSAAPIKGFKMVQYEDVETKTVKYIPFVNGKALLPIPKGYTEKKAAAPVAPVAPVVPVEDQAALARAGGGDGRGGKSETEGDGGSVSGEPSDAGIEGFGDIQGGTNPNIARAAGFAAGFINPIVGLLVGAAGAYATKENNKKMAAANAQAIDASALAAAGFDARDIRFAQEAAAKATLEGKSAKDIALAAANAASVNPSKSIGGEYGPKTSLDALVGITNGFNTANKAVMEMPRELVDKVPPSLWSQVVKEVAAGIPAADAVKKAVESVEGQISLAGLDGQVPAGEFNNVAQLMKEGYSAREAIDSVVMRGVTETDQEARNKREAETEAKNQETLNADRAAAESAEKADREARDQEKSEREASDREAAAREATNQATLNAAREAADRAEAQQAAADRAAAQQAEADRVPVGESRSGGSSTFPGGSGAGAFPGGGGAPPSGGSGEGSGGGLGEGSGGGRYA